MNKPFGGAVRDSSGHSMPRRSYHEGVITLVRESLNYHGALIGIDHGQGLVTYYAHLSETHVRERAR
jgi:murein DD-endopeptidase MepM/ murein hydrolase activator NlpD